MPTDPDLSDLPAIARHAARQLTLRDTGWSDEDAAEFALWRARDPRHEAAVQRLEAARALLRELPYCDAADDLMAEADALANVPTADGNAAPGARAVLAFPTQPRRRRWRVAASLVAACLIGVAAVQVSIRYADTPPESLVYQTAAERSTTDLADGSHIQFNQHSRAEVRFEAGARRVSLQQGEAYFEVAPDPARPFVVAAATVRVEAVGTAFNVRHAGDAVEVLVTEGTVRVTREDRPHEPLLLTHDQTARVALAFEAELPAAMAVNDFARRTQLAWQAPWLTFADTPLSEVVEEFNRYSPVQLELADAALAQRRIGGRFDAANAAAFAQILSAGGDVQLEPRGHDRIVLHAVVSPP